MAEELPHREPLHIDSERLRRITDTVAKIRFIRRLDEEMGGDTLPDFTGISPGDRNTDQEVYNAVLNGLTRGSSRQDVEAAMRQVDQRIEESGGLDAYLDEAERRMNERTRRPEKPAEKVNESPQPIDEETRLSNGPSLERRKRFGHSILRRLTGR